MNQGSNGRSTGGRNFPNGSHGLLRWAAVLSGGALALLGISRRSKSGVALAAAGGLLAYQGATFDPEKEFHAESSFAINCSPEKAYRFWRNLENLPRFMRHLHSVKLLDDRRSEWTALGRFDMRIRWVAEIVEEKENEWMVWRSLPGSDVDCRGSVHFHSATGNRGTIVAAAVQYSPPAGELGKAIATMVGKDPQFMMREDLRRFKALMEGGEVPTIDGQTHGPRSAVGKAMEMAYPEKRKATEFETNLQQLETQRSAS